MVAASLAVASYCRKTAAMLDQLWAVLAVERQRRVDDEHGGTRSRFHN